MIVFVAFALASALIFWLGFRKVSWVPWRKPSLWISQQQETEQQLFLSRMKGPQFAAEEQNVNYGVRPSV